jgi:hypothetical protein
VRSYLKKEKKDWRHGSSDRAPALQVQSPLSSTPQSQQKTKQTNNKKEARRKEREGKEGRRRKREREGEKEKERKEGRKGRESKRGDTFELKKVKGNIQNIPCKFFLALKELKRIRKLAKGDSKLFL